MMTMKSYLINAGNRTGDQLVIELIHADPAKSKRRTLGRGDKVDLWEFVGHDPEAVPNIRIYVGEHAAGKDEWAGEPQIMIADEPRKL